jgi:hypothetical protein
MFRSYVSYTNVTLFSQDLSGIRYNFHKQGISCVKCHDMECKEFCSEGHTKIICVRKTLRAAAHQLRQDKHQDMRQKRQKQTSAS